MINRLLMRYSRAALLVVLSAGLTSCQTFQGLMNSFPVRMLDGIGSQAMGFFAESGPDASKPASVQDRARQVESRGIYAGRSPAGVAPRQSMAAR